MAAAFLQLHERLYWPSQESGDLLEMLKGWLTPAYPEDMLKTNSLFNDLTSFEDGLAVDEDKVRKVLKIQEEAKITTESTHFYVCIRWWVGENYEGDKECYISNYGILNHLQEIEDMLKWAKGLDYTPFKSLKDPSREDYDNYARGIMRATNTLFETASESLDNLITLEMGLQYRRKVQEASTQYLNNLPESLKP